MSSFSLRQLALVTSAEVVGTDEMCAVIPLGNDLRKYSEMMFEAIERRKFIRGNGVANPKGVLAEEALPNAMRVHDERPYTLGYITTGVAGHFSMNDNADIFITLIHTLDARYRRYASFVVSTDVMDFLKRIKDSSGQMIWRPAMTVGDPEMLYGFPVYESEDMPLMKEARFSAMFGDFVAGYLIKDSPTRYEEDKANREFIATKRVDGYVKNFNAIKLLKFAEE